MSSKFCHDLAESRSAYVDEALPSADEQVLLRHLSDCGECRDDIVELRAVRALLTQARTHQISASTSPDLSQRLVSIAGQDAQAPLWTRPFRRVGLADALPSTRRRIRHRITAVVAVVGSLVVATAGVGYAAAPPMDVSAVADPASGARAEFSNVMAQLPLANDSINAVMMVIGSGLETGGARHSSRGPSPATGAPVDSAAAMTSLQRAVSAAQTLSYSGIQEVSAPRGDKTTSARVDVAFEPGQGSQLKVRNARGRELVEGFVPTPASSRIVDDELLALLMSHYTLSGAGHAQVAGRDASVVTASQPGADVVRARWWIDDDSGLLLWQETYDQRGALVQSAGFTSVAISQDEVFMDHLSPRLAVPTTTATLTLSSVGELSSQGWFCRQEMAGLSLIRLRAGGDETNGSGSNGSGSNGSGSNGSGSNGSGSNGSGSNGSGSNGADSRPGVLHMVYSDGLTTVSVFEQRGVLTTPPAGSHWDDTVRAYVSDGVPRIATWQSGGTSFSAVTDGSAAQLGEAVTSLPHQVPLSRTTMERVQAGWAHVLDLVNG